MTAWDRRPACPRPAVSWSLPVPLHAPRTRALSAALTRHGPGLVPGSLLPLPVSLVHGFSRSPQGRPMVSSPPGPGGLSAGPLPTAPLATRLRVADGRAAGHVLGMRWKAGCPQRPGLCPAGPHLAAGTASGGGWARWWHRPPSQELPRWPSTRSPRTAQSMPQARNHFRSCPRRGRRD